MIHDNIKDIILNYLVREEEERMRKNDVWKDQHAFDRSFSCPAVPEHDKYSEEVHLYTARIAPHVFDKDELTLAQAQGPELKFEWPLWIEATRKELTSFIIDNEAFEPVKWDGVPNEMHGTIFNLLILLKCNCDQHHEISKYKQDW